MPVGRDNQVMTSSKLLICLGLGLDIAGVILLYRYGLPSRYPDDRDAGLLRMPGIGPAPANPGAQRRFAYLSRSGLVCLVLGFVLQIVGTVILD